MVVSGNSTFSPSGFLLIEIERQNSSLTDSLLYKPFIFLEQTVQCFETIAN